MIIERDDEHRTLLSAVSRLEHGTGSVVLVSGEAGVGKSTLLSVFEPDIPAGIRVWKGACDNLVAGNPLGPLREALARTSPALLSTIEHAELHQVLSLLTRELAESGPTVLFVEDAHWADDATLDVLCYLARRIDQLPLLLVVTYRADETGPEHPTQRLLDAVHGSSAQRLPLSPLSLSGVSRMCRDTAWDPQRLHEITGGNPFYVTEALAVAPGGPPPATVSAAVCARMQRLPPQCRVALERLSAWTGVIDFETAEELLGDALSALNQAEAMGIIVVEHGGIRFRHELARRATEATLTGLRRRMIDRDIIEALKRRCPAALPRLVHHAIQCGDAATVAQFAPVAARRSAQAGAHRQALTLFEAALRQEHLLDRRELAEVLDGYAWELYNAHQFARAVDNAGRAVRLFTVLHDRAAESRARVRLSRHLFMNGDPVRARECAAEAVALLEDCPDADQSALASALTSLGALLAHDDTVEHAVIALDRARSIALRLGHRDVEALCLNYLAQADPCLDTDGRVALLRTSLELAEMSESHEYIARGYTNLGELLFRYGRYDELTPTLEAGLGFVRERGFWSHAYNLEVHQALLRLRRGDWAAARDQLRDLVERFTDPGMLILYSLAPYARLLARAGDPAAEGLLRSCWERALRQRILIGLGFTAAALVEWAWLNVRPEVPREVLTEWHHHAHRPIAAPLDAEILRYARRAGVPVNADHLRGEQDPWSRGLRGDWLSAAAEWARVGDSYEQALELADSGDPAHMVEAHQVLVDLKAEPAARRVRCALADLGVRSIPRGPSGRTQANPGGLTDRQLDVVALVADGMTNAEIAERLVLSPRTVDHHVAAILLKLGVKNRRGAASLARRWLRERDAGD